jgi:hypothetical protein
MTRNSPFPLASILLSCMFLSMATAADSVVVINEVQYHPTDPAEAGEWVELHNQMAVNVDLSGWRLSGGLDYEFPANTVISGKGYLVVAKTPGMVAGSIGPFVGTLNNAGDTIRLRNNSNRIMDEFDYGTKGDWPIAPDGSGVTLTKRDQNTASAPADSWTESAQVGGTPGARNFPLPAAGGKTTAFTMLSSWKYDTSGGDLGTAWSAPGFDDSAWSTGNAAFAFGNGSMYEDPPPAATGQGYWTVKRWTNDADSLVSTSKTYTHKVDFNRLSTATAAVINGVTFDKHQAAGAAVRTGTNWSLTGAATNSNNAGHQTPANNSFPTLAPDVSVGSRALMQDFYYGNSVNGISRIEMTGLTPGQFYVFTLYALGWDVREGRRNRITASDTGIGLPIDADYYGQYKPELVQYHYKCPASGKINLDFLPLNVPVATWHHYGFSNEVAATFTQETVITTTPTVADVSSEFALRGALNTINGAGLSPELNHSVAADNATWLTAGVGTDPSPWQVTYDLGAAQNLTSLRIWNYNELAGAVDNTTRGLKDVVISVSPDAVGETFTSAGSFVLDRASADTTEIGQRVPFATTQTGIRRVRIVATTNHGDASYAGLSEVKFFKVYVPDPTPVPAKEKITTLYNTGVNNAGVPTAYNVTDPHWNFGAPLTVQAYTPTLALPGTVAIGNPAIVSSPHTAWMQADGISNFIGFSGTGTDNVPYGQFTFSTTFDLSNYVNTNISVQAYVAADNQLDFFKLNGTAQPSITAAGFTTYLGPYNINGPFLPGNNTLDMLWTNTGAVLGPGAVRIKWDARAQRKPGLLMASNPITTYLRKKFTLSGAANSVYSMALQHSLDDGAVFYLNGVEIYRTNMPAGAITSSTPATADLPYPRTSMLLPLPANGLVVGENTFSVELHQSSASNADAFFDASLDVFESPVTSVSVPAVRFNEISGATATTSASLLELVNTTGSAITLTGYTLVSSGGGTFDLSATNIAANGLLSLTPASLGLTALDGEKLFLKGPGGTTVLDALVIKKRAQARDGDRWKTPSTLTPGAANTFSIPNSIVINEIMYKHAPAFLPTGKTNNPEQWLELYNKSGSAVSLAGWSLSGGISYNFPNTASIPAGGYLVVAKDKLTLAAKYPSISIVGDFSGSLNAEEAVRVEDPDNNIVNEVKFYGGGRWDDRANGGGSSLELLDPRADNSQPEAWAASDESGKSAWVNVEYQGLGAPTILDTVTNPAVPASREPALVLNGVAAAEFIMGLVAKGEYLIDDVSVIQDPLGTPVELVQNSGFESGASTAWRLLGTHGAHTQSVVVTDPSNAGQKVLKIVASDSAEHMHNHCETTLKNGAAFAVISPTTTYKIKFRARWVSGSPRLNTRLYFNRLPKQTLLPIPENEGTPGALNSRAVANAGPTFTNLSHAPILPGAGQNARVSIGVADPDAVAAVNLKWRLDPGLTWNTQTLTTSGGGIYSGDIPGQAAAALVQFYVEATDAAGSPATATFPAAGPKSGAFIRWSDGYAPTTPGHEFRFLMSAASTSFMFSATQGMSNYFLPTTLIYQGTEVFYDIGARTKSSERGRLVPTRLGFALTFDDMHKFRGVNGTINLDRSGLGLAGGAGSYGHGEIMNWQYINKAGNIPSMNNDMVYVISPTYAQVGSAMLTMAEFNDNYLDGQYANGSSGAVHKMDYIYYPTTTDNGTPEGLKSAATDLVIGVAIPWINSPTDKEAYRWDFLLGNAAAADDYQGIINMNQALRVPQGPAFVTAISAAVDVDEYLRASAAMVFTNATDHYSIAGAGQAHNLKLYTRPSDGRVLYLPWDHDFQSRTAVVNPPTTMTVTANVIDNGDLAKIIAASPGWERAFWGHVHNIMSTSFNRAYMDPWIDHFATFSTTGGNYAQYKPWIDGRRTQVLAQCSTTVPTVAFSITTNGGANFSDLGPLTTLAGKAWLDVQNLRVAGTTEFLPITWTAKDTWQIKLPVHFGANPFTIEGIGYDGTTVVASQSITITGTGTIVPADATNTVVSELDYHPSASVVTVAYPSKDDFEWIELQNISANTIELQGCHFDTGITYAFTASTLVPAGGRIVIPRRAAAFAITHPGVPVAPEYYLAADPTGNQFSNGGEEISLVDAAGRDVKRFIYDDVAPWPTSPDGGGKTMVLISPFSNPIHADPYSWRASLADEGTPSGTDGIPFTGTANADSNSNGIPDLTEFAIGNGEVPFAVLTDGPTPSFTFTLDRDTTSQTSYVIELSTDLTPSGNAGSWQAVVDPSVINRTPMTGNVERLTFSIPVPPSSANRVFIRGKFTAP